MYITINNMLKHFFFSVDS